MASNNSSAIEYFNQVSENSFVSSLSKKKSKLEEFCQIARDNELIHDKNGRRIYYYKQLDCDYFSYVLMNFWNHAKKQHQITIPTVQGIECHMKDAEEEL